MMKTRKQVNAAAASTAGWIRNVLTHQPASIVKRTLRILALVVAVAAVSVWLATGASRGWTRTSAPVKTVDSVTGIEGIEYRRQFVAGVDFLTGGLLGAAFLGGASLLFGNKATAQG
jgi:hypothetical protein